MLTLVVAVAAVLGTVGLAGPRASLPARARVHRVAAEVPAIGSLPEPPARAVARIEEPGRSALLAAVADRSVPLKAIGDAVAQAGKPLAKPLGEMLAAPDRETRERAAKMLEKLGKNARPAADAILRALADPSFGDRLSLVALLKFLEEMKGEAARAIPALLRELESPKVQRAHGAARVLAAMGDAALPAVRAWLSTGEPALPHAVLMAFGGTLREELIARFGEEATSYFEFVDSPAEEAFPALVAGTETDPLPVLRRRLREPLDGDRDSVFTALSFMGERAAPAVPDLVALLPDDELRADAARTLGAIGPAAAEAVPALERHVHESPEAIQALWRITGDLRYRALRFAPAEIQEGDDWALPRLVEGLTAQGAGWRRECAAALGRLGASARAAAPELARLAADESEDEYVRDAARAALASIG